MFGLSLTKILLTLFVIVAVWYGWRWFARFQALKATRARAVPPKGRAGESPRAHKDAGDSPRSARAQARVEPEETIECRACGAFVAASNAISCGRRDCPFPG